MNNSEPSSSEHIKLFIPGPVEIRREILEAQAQWMFGHRMPECIDLISAIRPKLGQIFRTQSPVLISASSGTGFWEGAVRNCVSDTDTILSCVNGAFSDRWHEVAELNGKRTRTLAVDWGQPILPEMVSEQLAGGDIQAVTIVHNETSTGVANPIQDIARAIRQAPNGDEIMILVDSVSGLSGAELEFDEWDLDVTLCSSQKAFALPPGLAFCAVSDRAMKKAATVPNRGYYFDFLTLHSYLERGQTPATPAISLLWALDRQLDSMLAEGIENRWSRHLAMRDSTLAWAKSRGFASFAAPGYESPTVTCVNNSIGVDIGALNRYLRGEGMILSNGYGKQLKNVTFRIAHMGDLGLTDLADLFAAIDRFLDR